jgi:DNA replication protein DnaC
MDNTEVIFFLHSLRETKYLKKMEKEIFKNPYVSSFFWLVKEFHNKYGELPVDPDEKSLEQVNEILNYDEKYFLINPDVSKEKNKEAFLSNCHTILANNYSRYNRKALEENMSAWVDWENFQNSYIRASQYMKTTAVTPDNVRDVINKARNIINDFALSDDDDDYKDFYDPDFHANDDVDDIACRTTGFVNFDLLCNSKGDGVKEGNLIILVGAPNIGKTIFLANIAISASMHGSNVLFVSLEMDERDMKERLSGKAFNIKMDEYEDKRKQVRVLLEDIDQEMAERGEKRGELLLKRMYSPTHTDLDAAVKKIEKEKGIKIHFLVLDYFTEMGNAHNIRPDNAFNTYMYHKTNAKGLFDCAGEGAYRTITAHQSSNIDPEASDIFIDNLSESKGILHSPDGVIGIIQNSSMKTENRYFLKGLKTRHSKFKNYYVMFEINYAKMSLSERAIYSPDEYSYDGVTAKTENMGNIA